MLTLVYDILTSTGHSWRIFVSPEEALLTATDNSPFSVAETMWRALWTLDVSCICLVEAWVASWGVTERQWRHIRARLLSSYSEVTEKCDALLLYNVSYAQGSRGTWNNVYFFPSHIYSICNVTMELSGANNHHKFIWSVMLIVSCIYQKLIA